MPEKPVPLLLLRPSRVQQLPQLRVQPPAKGKEACLHGSGALATTPRAPLFYGMPPWAMCFGGSADIGLVHFSR